MMFFYSNQCQAKAFWRVWMNWSRKTLHAVITLVKCIASWKNPEQKHLKPNNLDTSIFSYGRKQRYILKRKCKSLYVTCFVIYSTLKWHFLHITIEIQRLASRMSLCKVCLFLTDQDTVDAWCAEWYRVSPVCNLLQAGLLCLWHKSADWRRNVTSAQGAPICSEAVRLRVQRSTKEPLLPSYHYRKWVWVTREGTEISLSTNSPGKKLTCLSFSPNYSLILPW